MVAVTGASGHLGGNLVRLLLANGERVRAMVHDDERALVGLDVQCVPGDILSPASLIAAFEGCERVYHLAALISVTGSQDGRVERVNVEGAGNAAKAAREVGVSRFVHVSSVHAFAHSPDVKLDEQAPRPGPQTPAYDRSKAAGELAVLREVEHGLAAVIVNPSGVLGPYDFAPSRMGQSVIALAKGKFPAIVEGGFDWVDVRDVCASIVAAGERGRVGEGYLLGGKWASMVEIAQSVAKAAGRAPVSMVAPRWLALAAAPLAEWAQACLGQAPLFTREGLFCVFHGSKSVDWGKANRELGHMARPLEETIGDTVAWFRQTGNLE